MVEKKMAFFAELDIQIGSCSLGAYLNVPADAKGIVLFAHGSGSSRHSSRNQAVAKYLQEENIGTLLLDLLTHEEEVHDSKTRALRFNIPFLAKRLIDVTEWIRAFPETKDLSIGYFGASTGAAAALIAALEFHGKINAIVSRGGRPDLAGNVLPSVKAPTLLIVGGADHGVIQLNQRAYEQLECEKDIQMIEGATHLFEEEGALEEVAKLAARWFDTYL